MTSRLANIISDLYKAFEKYPSGPSMTASPNYSKSDVAKWNQELFSKPLRELFADDLSRFAGKTMTTWGNQTDFKHFLPRILDLTAQWDTPYEVWVVFDRLEMAEWTSWSNQEQMLIKEFTIALWEALLNDESEKAEWQFQDYFSTLAHFYTDFNELLKIWEDQDSKAAIKHISNMVVDEYIRLFKQGTIFGLHDKKDNSQALKKWLLSEKIRKLLEAKYFEYEGEDFAEKISMAEQLLTEEVQK